MSDFIEQIPHRIDTLEKAFASTLSLPTTTPVVVLDTNVLLDWLYWGNEEVAQLSVGLGTVAFTRDDARGSTRACA